MSKTIIVSDEDAEIIKVCLRAAAIDQERFMAGAAPFSGEKSRAIQKAQLDKLTKLAKLFE